MAALEVAGLVIFFLIIAAGMIMILFGLPGCWIILADALVYGLITRFEQVTLWVLLLLLVMASAAEGLEFIAGIYGTKYYGASRRGIAGAIVGAIIGAILMSPLLFLIGAVLGAFVGAFLGASLVEYLNDRNYKRALRAGMGAFLGKLGGILAKEIAAVAMLGILIYFIFQS
jgi:uncharacterized protein YqgC (DUF456 family)